LAIAHPLEWPTRKILSNLSDLLFWSFSNSSIDWTIAASLPSLLNVLMAMSPLELAPVGHGKPRNMS
jgi:hypothetical protein